jgi:hypothetical protein
MKNPLRLAAILVIALSFVTSAQEPSVKSSLPAKNAEASAKLLLEIVFNPEMPPSYLTVNGSVWTSRFVRLPSAPIEPSIRAVRLASKFNGETADIRVSLMRGSDQEDLVGVYQVGVGEKKTLNDLRAVGVGPINITLLNVIPPLPPPPTFENRTKSIEIVSVLSENMPEPAYRITFRNLSDKNLLALRVDVFRDGRPGTSTLIQGEEGRPAIEAGGIIERYMPVAIAQRTPMGFVPGAAAANTIFIRTAVFADMSFEGEPESACLFESFLMERRVWLRNVLRLLNRELAKPTNEDQIEAARQFKEKFAALNYEFNESERNQVSAVSSVCAKPFDKARTGVLKQQVLRELNEIITSPRTPPVNFRLWLETHRAHYIAWFTRL